MTLKEVRIMKQEKRAPAAGIVASLLFFLSVIMTCMGLLAIPKISSAVERDVSFIFPDDASRGWKLFLSKNCIHCHTIWGQGDGTIGPDLGRMHISLLSEGQIATNIVNHLPTMWEKMREEGIRYEPISAKEMGDLFSFLYFIRYVDEPGDPVKGKTLLAARGCTTCHSILGKGGSIGPDLTRWGVYINPIVWAQKMWEHAPRMEKEMMKRNMSWPILNAEDMVDLVAYIQSIGGKIQEEHHLEPGAPVQGRTLFKEKGCIECHSVEGEGRHVGPDFGKIEFPRTLAGMAALMWNHSPEMMKMMKIKKIPRKHIDPQEMADIIAYLFAVRYFDPPGDPSRGEKVFEEKNCVICHTVGGGGRAGTIGPNLARLSKSTVITLTDSIWNHGPTMMQKMRDYGFSWPVLEGSDINDIVSYLQSVKSKK
jgi:mono/diheme cytochrome c family protein